MNQCHYLITFSPQEVPRHTKTAKELDSKFSELKDAILGFPTTVENSINHNKATGFWQRMKEKIEGFCALIYQVSIESVDFHIPKSLSI